jgi:hypothetical protein
MRGTDGGKDTRRGSGERSDAPTLCARLAAHNGFVPTAHTPAAVTIASVKKPASRPTSNP